MKKNINSHSCITSYYRFRIDSNPESEEYELNKIIRKGKYSFFDEIYEKGVITKFSVTLPTTASKKIGNVHFKFIINDDTKINSVHKVFFGLNGRATIIGKPGRSYGYVLYRILESDCYEVIVCDEKSKMNCWERLKEGKLDAKINEIIAST